MFICNAGTAAPLTLALRDAKALADLAVLAGHVRAALRDLLDDYRETAPSQPVTVAARMPRRRPS